MNLTQTPKQGIFEESRDDRAKSLDALHEVEWAVSEPGPGRPEEWRYELLPRLDELAARLHEQFDNSESDHGLLHEIAMDEHRLGNAVTEIQQRQQSLVAEIDSVRLELSDLTRSLDVKAVRIRLAELTVEMRELRAWETDLVYEAYTLDLGVGH